MNEGFMYVEGSEIVINTRSVQVASLENDDPFIINDQEVSLKKVELSSDFIHEIPYSTNKLVYKVTIDNFKEDRDLSFRLVCGDDEYFFAVQEDYLQLLDNESDDYIEF
jgi:hypothetical protein